MAKLAKSAGGQILIFPTLYSLGVVQNYYVHYYVIMSHTDTHTNVLSCPQYYIATFCTVLEITVKQSSEDLATFESA